MPEWCKYSQIINVGAVVLTGCLSVGSALAISDHPHIDAAPQAIVLDFTSPYHTSGGLVEAQWTAEVGEHHVTFVRRRAAVGFPGCWLVTMISGTSKSVLPVHHCDRDEVEAVFLWYLSEHG